MTLENLVKPGALRALLQDEVASPRHESDRLDERLPMRLDHQLLDLLAGCCEYDQRACAQKAESASRRLSVLSAGGRRRLATPHSLGSGRSTAADAAMRSVSVTVAGAEAVSVAVAMCARGAPLEEPGAETVFGFGDGFGHRHGNQTDRRASGGLVRRERKVRAAGSPYSAP